MSNGHILSTKSGKSEWWFLVLISTVWGYSLLGYIVGFSKILPIVGQFADAIPYVAIFLPLFLSFSLIQRKLRSFDILFYLIICIFYLIESASYPYNTEIPKHAYSFLMTVLPCYFIGRMMDIEVVDKLLYYVSIFGVVVTSAYYLIYAQGHAEVDTEHYNMDGAYDLLRYSLFVISFALRKKNLYSILASVLSVVMILSFGTRGPLVCVITFIALHILLLGTFKYAKTIITIVLLICLTIYNFLDEIMLGLQYFLQSIHMSTRIVDKYFVEEIGVSVAREDISSKLLNVMQNSSFPFFGEGICGSWRFVGIYPHNLFVDILFSFGYWFGGILLVALFFLVIKSYIITRTSDAKSFILVLFCASIVKLFMSGTYLDESALFLLIGYTITLIRNKHTDNA